MNSSESHKSFVAALGRIPSGLFILTARKGDVEMAMLASWVQQCSFDPPQLTLAVEPKRDIASCLIPGGTFTLNILDDSQTDMIARFGKGAKLGEPVFNGLDVRHLDESGPVILEALAFLECRVVARFNGGDHDLVIGQVVRGEMLGDGHPMVHIRKSGLHY